MSTLDELLLPSAESLKNENRDEFIKALMSSLVLTTKSSNNLPNDYKDNNSFQYFRMFQEFAEATDGCSKTTLALIKSISSYVQKDEKRRIDLPDDIENPLFYESIVDILDVLLDSADSHIKNARAGVVSPRTNGQTLDNASVTVDRQRIVQSSQLECPKPQLKFLEEIDNSRERPFRPRLIKKYHYCQPLNLTERSNINQDGDDIDVDENRYMGERLSASTYFAHPYEAELGTLSYMEWQMVDASRLCPDKPADPSSESFAMVDTETALDQMVIELMRDNIHEIAVDLEHHSMRTFQGLTCLMQISTRKKDYVIDTLTLRRSIHKLGPVFDNPAVVKIFHGCERDILWLQRDFGLYVVNCFDTYFAAKALRYPALSLAHLVRMHCNVVLNKKHQLSDWRQRPLPEDMISYARSDTHYLLYTYDCIRRDLWKSLGKEGLENVLDASRKMCLSRYEKPAFYPRGYQRQVKEFFIASKGSVKSQESSITIEEISTLQDCVLNRLWNWRDLTARNEDESPEYILSNAELVRIGLAMPTSAAQFERVHSVKGTERAEAILRVINDAISIGPAAVSSSPRSTLAGSPGENAGAHSKAQLKASTSNAKSAEASTVYTFTPAVLPKPLPQGQSSPVGQILGQRGGKVVMASPVMAVDEIFRLAGWSTPSIFSQQQPNPNPTNNNASLLNLQHRQSLSPLPAYLGASDGRNGPSPFSFASTEALRHVELSDENKQKLERSKEEQKSDFDRKLMKLTASKSDLNIAESSSDRLGGKMSSSMGDMRFSMESEQSAHCINNHSSHSLEAAEEEENESQSPTTIPESYEEIYKISLKNRQRNKDKKRNREGHADQNDASNAESDPNFPIASFTGVPSSDSGTLSDGGNGGASMRGKVFDYTTYFSQSGDGSAGKTTTLTSVDSTLELASELGWVKNKTQYEAVKEAYMVEVSNQQQQSSSEGDEQHAVTSGPGPSGSGCGGGSGSGGGGNQLRRSNDKPHKSAASGSVNSAGVAAGGGNSRYATNAKKAPSGDNSHHQHHQHQHHHAGGQDSSNPVQQLPPPNNNSNNSMAAPQKFDYSKLHSQQAMSALPGRDRESRPKGYHGGKPKQDSANNPYLYKPK